MYHVPMYIHIAYMYIQYYIHDIHIYEYVYFCHFEFRVAINNSLRSIDADQM